MESHAKWIDDINSTQRTTVSFPIIADADRKVSLLYDLIHPNASVTATVRSLFVIDPAKKIRLVITYPASTGRNFDEILRVIDSLQLTDGHSVATPGNWKQGEDVVMCRRSRTPKSSSKSCPRVMSRSAPIYGSRRNRTCSVEREPPYAAHRRSSTPGRQKL